jgi:hypothetical protein
MASRAELSPVFVTAAVDDAVAGDVVLVATPHEGHTAACRERGCPQARQYVACGQAAARVGELASSIGTIVLPILGPDARCGSIRAKGVDTSMRAIPTSGMMCALADTSSKVGPQGIPSPHAQALLRAALMGSAS